ncbi:MAG: hypothetical protein EOP10_10085 [Proteobacteria bacterium]|nr:MAG: hypothetical protein EOP10_10085 [Pseudomonadota bacterium]
MKLKHLALTLLVSLPASAAALSPYAYADTTKLPDVKKLEAIVSRFAPVDLTVDLSKLADNEKQALAKLIQASDVIETIYMRQVWDNNLETRKELQKNKDKSPLDKARFDAFMLDKGPWSAQDHHIATIPNVQGKPEAGTYYPKDSSKVELEAWMKGLSADEAKKAKGFFWVVRRDDKGKLKTVPYSQEYLPEIKTAAALLKEAAALTTQKSLKDFLDKRAEAFLSDDYYASDVAWMKLDASIEPTIGPYETYEDGWFSAKAAFESFITIRDEEETAKLAKFSAELQELENNLPFDPKFRNPKLGALAPIRVVNSIYSAGEANRGIQTAAYNLPNDEKIATEMGTKRTMLKNIQEAKFEKVLTPISRIALAKADQSKIAFDAFFTHILMHELMHGLGPSTVTEGGKAITVREKLQETYSAMEEAKADVSGLWALQRLIDKGVLSKDLEKTLYTTYLASTFRSIRFGLNEAHGKAVALQMNYFLDA